MIPTCPLEKKEDEFELEDWDGVLFRVRWRFFPEKPTKRPAGITGWADMDGNFGRAHVCFQYPCQADHPLSKYGDKPRPRHGRLPGWRNSLAVAPPASAAVAAPPDNAEAAVAAPPDNAEAAVAAPTPPASASIGQALPAQTDATTAQPTDNPALTGTPEPQPPLPPPASPPESEEGGEMLALEPEILFNPESVEMTPDAEAEFPSVPELPSAMAEAAFAMAEAPSAMAEASEDIVPAVATTDNIFLENLIRY